MKLTEVKKATERLRGIMMGISIDGRIDDREIFKLNKWLSMYPVLHNVDPFKTVVDSLNKIIEDHYIDEEEREEVLDLCYLFDKKSLIPGFATTAIRRLHGVLQGIAADDKFRYEEIMGLKSWIAVHQEFKQHWPFCEVWEMANRMLEDGIIDDQEKAELSDYCKNFSETRIENPIIHDAIYEKEYMTYFSPVLETFTALCDRHTSIIFDGNKFCFTGPARSGPRKTLHAIVKKLGGKPSKNVTQDLDYLVIGAQSSPCWAYSTYGRKIEKVIALRKAGSDITILHEDDFIEQAKQ